MALKSPARTKEPKGLGGKGRWVLRTGFDMPKIRIWGLGLPDFSAAAATGGTGAE